MFVLFMSVLLIGRQSMAADDAVVYKSTKMECSTNPKYTINAVCKLKPVNWYKSVSNMDVDIIRPVTNFTLHFQVFWKNAANQYQPFIINVTNNMCDALNKKSFPGYTTIILKILKEVSNINHTCPYMGRVSARNLYIDERFLPIAFPLGIYKFVFVFMEGYPYETFGGVTIYIQAIEKQKLRPKPLPKNRKSN